MLAQRRSYEVEFKNVKGSTRPNGLEVATAGGQNIALIGLPAQGKPCCRAACLPILPPMSFDEAIETTRIHSAGLLSDTYHVPLFFGPKAEPLFR